MLSDVFGAGFARPVRLWSRLGSRRRRAAVRRSSEGMKCWREKVISVLLGRGVR